MTATAAESSGAVGFIVAHELTTQRLTLRPMAMSDVAALHDILADPVVMQYFDTPHADMETTSQWVSWTVSQPRDTTRDYVLLYQGEVIGKAGIWSAPETGFLLAKAHWGKGLMREALECLLPQLAKDMGLDQITADVDPANERSLTLLKSMGFVETGSAKATIKIKGVWCDSLYLAKSIKL